MNTLNIWFLTGSQDLYGDDALHQVAQHIQKMVGTLNESGSLPLPLVGKPVQKSAGQILQTIQHAEADPPAPASSAGCIPSAPQMWIAGLSASPSRSCSCIPVQRTGPLRYDGHGLLNLNQSAHGDREFGFITARMIEADRHRRPLVPHRDAAAHRTLDAQCHRGRGEPHLVVARFGDNMRDVAVTTATSRGDDQVRVVGPLFRHRDLVDDGSPEGCQRPHR